MGHIWHPAPAVLAASPVDGLWWLPALLAGFGVGAVVAGVVVVALCLRRRTSLVAEPDDDAPSGARLVDRRVLDGDRDRLL